MVSRRRAKMGAKEMWFSRRRGGQEESLKKENKWRDRVREPALKPTKDQTCGAGKRRRRQAKEATSSQPQDSTPRKTANQGQGFISTLSGSLLDRIQVAETGPED